MPLILGMSVAVDIYHARLVSPDGEHGGRLRSAVVTYGVNDIQQSHDRHGESEQCQRMRAFDAMSAKHGCDVRELERRHLVVRALSFTYVELPQTQVMIDPDELDDLRQCLEVSHTRGTELAKARYVVSSL